MFHAILITAIVHASIVPSTIFVAVAEGDPCPQTVGIKPETIEFWSAFNYNDPDDIILPLAPGQDGLWDIPVGYYKRKPMRACDDSGDPFKIEVVYVQGLKTQPSIVYEPENSLWSPTINIPQGLWMAVFRATDFDPNEPKYQDYILCGRGVRVNHPPQLQ